MATTKFSRGARIYPNLAALDETMPHGHQWGMHRVGMGWCSKEDRRAEPVKVARVMKGGSNGLREPKYELEHADGRRVQMEREWVEKHFRSEGEHIDLLLTLAGSPFESVRRVRARNELMDLGDKLTIEVSAFRGDSYASAFENLLSAWPKYQYRPTLSLRVPAAKALADIYDATQAVRGIDVVAFRSNG